MPVIPSIWGWGQKDQKSAANHGYIANLKPAWATWDPASKNKQTKRAPHLTGNKKGDEMRQEVYQVFFILL